MIYNYITRALKYRVDSDVGEKRRVTEGDRGREGVREPIDADRMSGAPPGKQKVRACILVCSERQR